MVAFFSTPQHLFVDTCREEVLRPNHQKIFRLIRLRPRLEIVQKKVSPDDEPEDYVVTEIQRVARGNFERRSIRQARVSTAEEIEKLKAEYEVKLRQLKAQHEEDLRKVYATIREAYVQTQKGQRG